MTTIHYRSVEVDGLKIFYREARKVDTPKLLLLHGFRPRATCSVI
jgi:hypothetical protein